MARQLAFSPSGVSTGRVNEALAQASLFDDLGATVTRMEQINQQETAKALSGSISRAVSELQVRADELASEHKSDPVAYEESYGAYAETVAQGLPPEIAPQFMDQASLIGRQHLIPIREQAQAELDSGAKVNIDNALTIVQQTAEKALQEGDLVGFQQANTSFNFLLDSNGGLFTPLEVDQRQKTYEKAVDRSQRLGLLQRSEDPLGLIDKMSDDLTAEEMEDWMADYATMLEQDRFVEEEREKLTDAEFERIQLETEAEATALFSEGLLTRDYVTTNVRSGRLKPSVGRTLLNSMGDEGGSDILLFDYLLQDPLSVSDEEILSANLTETDKRAVLKARRDLLDDSENWRNSQGAREGARRIRGSLGLVGMETIMAQLDTELARRVNGALTEWYGKVDSLPVDRRPQEALSIADEVVEKINLETDRRNDLSREKRRIGADMQTLDEDSPERKAMQRRLDEINEELGV